MSTSIVTLALPTVPALTLRRSVFEKQQAVINFFKANPGSTVREAAQALGLPISAVNYALNSPKARKSIVGKGLVSIERRVRIDEDGERRVTNMRGRRAAWTKALPAVTYKENHIPASAPAQIRKSLASIVPDKDVQSKLFTIVDITWNGIVNPSSSPRKRDEEFRQITSLTAELARDLVSATTRAEVAEAKLDATKVRAELARVKMTLSANKSDAAIAVNAG